MRRIYEFAAFRLDPAQRSLKKNGESVALHAKAFDALVYLVEHAGEPVSRRALTEALWPKRVVEENNLTQAISALRRALGEDCIVTLAGRGYQFVAEVRAVGVDPNAVTTAMAESSSIADEPPSVTIAPSDPAPRSAATRRVMWVGASIAVAAVIGIAVYFSPSPAERPARPAPQSEPLTVLVLPFETQSEFPLLQVLADELTDDLIFRLQPQPSLRVMGRATSFALRGSSVPESAARVGVQYVVGGSVGFADDGSLRIQVHISDANGLSVWGASFERSLEELIETQDEFVARIAAQLGAPIGVDLASQPATTNVSAYLLYLSARAPVRSGDLAAYVVALERVNSALGEDMEFAGAWSLKAQIHAALSTNSTLPEERARQLDFAAQAAERAIALAPTDGEGHVARATTLGVVGDWSSAERDYDRARDLGYPVVSALPFFQLSTGRVALARETLEQMLQTDPLNEATRAMLMLCYEISGQPDKADALYEQGRFVHDSWALGRRAWTWIQLGRESDDGPFEDVSAQFVGAAIEPEDARARLRRAAVQPEYASAEAKANLAIYAAYHDDAPLALQLLQEATATQALLHYELWLPVFHDIRQTPEFKEMLVNAGLPQYWRATGWPEVCRRREQTDFACD